MQHISVRRAKSLKNMLNRMSLTFIPEFQEGRKKAASGFQLMTASDIGKMFKSRL